MNRPSLFYFAHPVAPPCACGDHGDHLVMVACNLARAKRWLRWCREIAQDVVIIAPWMVDVDVDFANDADPVQRERGLVGCCVTVRRCDGIILAGGRLSPGMARELEAFTRSRPLHPIDMATTVVDLRPLGDEPPGPDEHQSIINRLRSLR